MNANGAIEAAMNVNSMVLKSYLGDLSDAELLTRPGEGCNHLAWQLGHLIASECSLLESICPGASVTLPDGFAEQHSKETTGENDAAKFCSKEEYFNQLDRVQEASRKALASMSEADFDQPSPEHFREMFPTVGEVFMLIATHGLMHAGQFVPVRRMLGKPVVI